MPGFYARTGVGKSVAEGKEVKALDGEGYILDRGIRAELAVIKGRRADESGNFRVPHGRAQLQPADGDRRPRLRRRAL